MTMSDDNENEDIKAVPENDNEGSDLSDLDPVSDLDDLDPKDRGLGRGLDALFGDDGDDDEFGGLGSSETRSFCVDVDQLEPNPSQPRQDFNDKNMKELAESISTHGILQPILVRPKEGAPGTYQIVAGERRWKAAQMAQLHEIPVIVREIDDSETLQLALIENLQREDLNPLEEANSYRSLIERFGFNQERVAAVLGKSRSHVANTIRLLSLPDSIQTYLWEKKLTAGHARAILTAKDPESLAREVVAKGLSVRDTEKLANEQSGKPPKVEKGTVQKDADTLALEEEVSNTLGMQVTINTKADKSGSLKIVFKDMDQLDEILHRLSHYPETRQVEAS